MKAILETALFTEPYAYKMLQTIKERYNIDSWVIDSLFVDNAKTKDLNENSLRDKSYYHLLHRDAPVEIIDSKNFKFQTPIKEICEANKDVILVTQSESVAKNFNHLFLQTQHKLYYFTEERLTEWSLKSVNLNAFYAEPDKYNFGILPPVNMDYVFSPKYGYLKIEENPLHEGGEGAVYKTYQNFLAKIYKPKHQTYQNYKKLLKMVQTPMDNPHIVWPKDIVYYNGNFMGYIMENITSKESMDDLRDSNFEGYSSVERLEIAISFMQNIQYLHARNVLVGDMKLDNILVQSPKDVFIIDSGSFQIDDYPCVVYSLEYSEKKYSEEELKKSLRSVESEYYPINRIIFETLFLKSPHYSVANTEIGAEENKHFNYPLNIPTDRNQIKEYEKPWLAIPQKIRESFYYYFKERRITYLPELIQDFEVFKNSISGGRPS